MYLDTERQLILWHLANTQLLATLTGGPAWVASRLLLTKEAMDFFS
jgi:hypothetical protein